MDICVDELFNIKDNIYTSPEYMVISLKTTGLNPNFNQIVEICYKLIKDNEVKYVYNEQFKSFMWRKTLKYCPFTKEELEVKTPFMSKSHMQDRSKLKVLFHRCIDHNDNLVLVGQYLPFTEKWLGNKLNINFNGVKHYDTMEIDKALNQDAPHDLNSICKRYGIIDKDDSKTYHKGYEYTDLIIKVMEHQFEQTADEDN